MLIIISSAVRSSIWVLLLLAVIGFRVFVPKIEWPIIKNRHKVKSISVDLFVYLRASIYVCVPTNSLSHKYEFHFRFFGFFYFFSKLYLTRFISYFALNTLNLTLNVSFRSVTAKADTEHFSNSFSMMIMMFLFFNSSVCVLFSSIPFQFARRQTKLGARFLSFVLHNYYHPLIILIYFINLF